MELSYQLLPVSICQKSIKLPILIRLKISWVNSIHLFFSVLLYHQLTTDFCYLQWLSSVELWRKKKINGCSNISHNLNGKIISTVNVKMITLKNLVRKSMSLPFKKNHPYTIISLPLQFIGLIPSERGK